MISVSMKPVHIAAPMSNFRLFVACSSGSAGSSGSSPAIGRVKMLPSYSVVIERYPGTGTSTLSIPTTVLFYSCTSFILKTRLKTHRGHRGKPRRTHTRPSFSRTQIPYFSPHLPSELPTCHELQAPASIKLTMAPWACRPSKPRLTTPVHPACQRVCVNVNVCPCVCVCVISTQTKPMTNPTHRLNPHRHTISQPIRRSDPQSTDTGTTRSTSRP